MSRPSALPAVLALVLLAGAGCSTPCQELGYKLCECRASGTSKNTCENTVDDELDRANPSDAEQDLCEKALKTCDAPKGVSFCTWVESTDGKEQCGFTYLGPP